MAIKNNVFTEFPSDVPQVMSMLEYVSQAIKIANSVRKDADDGVFNGEDGVGIASIVFGSDYKMTVTMTDGTTYVSPVLRGATGATGADGEDGVGIASIVFGSDYKMTVTMTDGTTYVSQSLRGEKGATGSDGVGISNITFNNDIMTITMTDGTTYTSPSLRNFVNSYNVNRTITVGSVTTTVSGRVTIYSGRIAHWALTFSDGISHSATQANRITTGVNGPYVFLYQDGASNFNYKPVEIHSVTVSADNQYILANGYLDFTTWALTNNAIGVDLRAVGYTDTPVKLYVDVWGTYEVVS